MINFRSTENSVRSVPLTTGKRKKNELSGRRSARTTKKRKKKKICLQLTEADTMFCHRQLNANKCRLSIQQKQILCNMQPSIVVHLCDFNKNAEQTLDIPKVSKCLEKERDKKHCTILIFIYFILSISYPYSYPMIPTFKNIS